MVARPGSPRRSPVTPTRSTSRSATAPTTRRRSALTATRARTPSPTSPASRATTTRRTSRPGGTPSSAGSSSSRRPASPATRPARRRPSRPTSTSRYLPITDAAHGSLACSRLPPGSHHLEALHLRHLPRPQLERRGDESCERRRLHVRLDLLLQLPQGAERLGTFVDTAVCRRRSHDAPVGPGTGRVVAPVRRRRGAWWAWRTTSPAAARIGGRARSWPRRFGRSWTSRRPFTRSSIRTSASAAAPACGLPRGRHPGARRRKATLVNASKCIGHGRCASECPVQAIRLVFGTAERGVDLPEVDERFETARPGVHVVGELGGHGPHPKRPRARAAGRRARAAARWPAAPGRDGGSSTSPSWAPARPGSPPRSARARRIVVRAPRARHGRRHRRPLPAAQDRDDRARGPALLRQLRPAAHVERRSDRGASANSWQRARIQVHEQHEGHAASTATADDFTVDHHARRLAGAPRRAGDRPPRHPRGAWACRARSCAERRLPPHRSRAVRRAPRAGGGRRRLGAGGGHPAGRRIARRGRRSPTAAREFGRCRPANQTEAGRRCGPRPRARADVDGGRWRWSPRRAAQDRRRTRTLPNDFVIACLGGELPDGVPEVGRGGHPAPPRRQGDAQPGAGRARASTAARAAGGRCRWRHWRSRSWCCSARRGRLDYYLLPRALRYRDPRHALLKPSGAWGHGVGILATLFMLSNFAYSVASG